MTDKIPDSEWLASMVVAAFTEQRYELGEALARLCGRAVRMEQAGALAAAPLDPAVYAALPKPEHVLKLVQTHEAQADTELCQEDGCATPIRWSRVHLHWYHINSEGKAVAPWFPHDGKPPAAVNESNAPDDTLVTPSARCIAKVYTPSGTDECHGVLYWATSATGPAIPGWLHLDRNIDGHIPVANVPDPS